MILVGRVESYDHDTGNGVVVSHDGRRGRFDRRAAENAYLGSGAEGTPVICHAHERKGGIGEVYLMRSERNEGPGQPGWPKFGEIAQLVCTVAFVGPDDRHRFLWHPDIECQIMVRPKANHIRRDLRAGDPVIAEVVRWGRRLVALHTVRLPKSYEPARRLR